MKDAAQGQHGSNHSPFGMIDEGGHETSHFFASKLPQSLMETSSIVSKLVGFTQHERIHNIYLRKNMMRIYPCF